jgi:DNA-binding transcriptional LysR family regulator
MNLQQLVTFSTVLNEGSMTAAAEKLFLTQPAVSQQIRNLEEEMGVELLVRGVRQAKPTLQGQILYEYAKRIISLTQQAEIAIQTIGAKIEGTLRIGTVNSLGLYLLSPVVGLFLKHNSKLNIKLTYAGGEELIDRMDAGDMDIVILPEAGPSFGREPANANKQFLVKDEIWLVASSREGQLPTRIHLKEFTTRPHVSLTATYPVFERTMKERLQEAGAVFQPVFESTNVGTLKRVVESGLGWGFLPSHSIYKQVRMGRMSVIDVEDLTYSAPIFYYTPKGVDHPAFEVFFKALQQQVGGRKA